MDSGNQPQYIQTYRFEEKPPKPDSVIAFVKNRSRLRTQSSAISGCLSIQSLTTTSGEFIRLFSVDDTDFYLGEEQCAPKSSNYEYVIAHAFDVDAAQRLAFASIVAVSLASGIHIQKVLAGDAAVLWKKNHKERMLCCPSAKNMVFPKISPAVIVAVFDGDRILLTNTPGVG